MKASTTHSAQQLLDEVRRPTQLDAFDVDGYVRRLETEVAAGDDAAALAARDLTLRESLAAIDAFACRVMRISIDHVLADDTSVPAQFRTYLAAQVLDYDGDLERLRARVQQAAARIDPDGATDTAAAVTNAGAQVLVLRASLRTGVLGLTRTATPAEPEPAPTSSFFDNIELD